MVCFLDDGDGMDPSEYYFICFKLFFLSKITLCVAGLHS